MLIPRMLALLFGKVEAPPKSTFEEMREALKPDKVHPPPPRPLQTIRIHKRN